MSKQDTESQSQTPKTEVDVWQFVRDDAVKVQAKEPALSAFLDGVVLSHDSLESVVAFHLGAKLGNGELGSETLSQLFLQAFQSGPAISAAMRADVIAIVERDPACQSYLDPVLYYKGFLVLQAYRGAHFLIENDRRALALYIQNRASEVFQADLHPSAIIGSGIFMDHSTGIVIGETAVVGNDVSMLHGVTLGGSGKERGDRHPKIGNGVLISVGAKVLGNIRVGDCAKIGGGSVVLTDVPAYSTAVGVPAKVVGRVSTPEPSRQMDHTVESQNGENSKTDDA